MVGLIAHRRRMCGDPEDQTKLYRMRDTWYLFWFIPIYSRTVDV